jgi:putative methyltransferase (TIGR04325 family)
MRFLDQLQTITHRLLPPVLLDAARWARRRVLRLHRRQDLPEWEYVQEGWARQDDPHVKGWNVESVLEAYLARWPAFAKTFSGLSPWALSPEANAGEKPSLSAHNLLMSYAYALSLASRQKVALSMLDWGGGIGHYYLISQALFADLQVDYHCKDLPILADYGRGLFPDAHFYTDETLPARQFDFVLASSSLHYSQDWMATLESLARHTANYLFVTRLPIVHTVPSYVMLQRAYAYGYNTEYLGWCLNRGEFVKCAGALGLTLAREFIVEAPPVIENAPEQCEFRGFLFRPAGGDHPEYVQ